MWPYWLTIILPIILSLLHDKISLQSSKILKHLYLIYLIIFIGLRFQVGGDWFQYEDIFRLTIERNIIFDVKNDVIFTLLVRLIAIIGQDIVVLNLILALIFVYSINYFIDKETDWFLVYVTIIPIYIIIIGMGFIRQASAIAFFLLSTKLMFNNSFIRSGLFFIFSLGFHKTILPYGIIYFLSIKNIYQFFLISLTLIASFILFYDNFIRLLYYYAGEGVHFISFGSIQRLGIIFLFATIFIIFQKKLINNDNERRVILTLSIIVLIITPFVFFYSSAIDRLAFYAIPVQIFCIMRSHRLFKSKNKYLLFKLGIYFISLLIIFVWINFSIHKVGWLPYQNYLVNAFL